MSENLNRNKKIKKVEVGIRELRSVYVYPLSMQDQFDLIDRLAEVIEQFGSGFDKESITNEKALEMMQSLIKDNLMVILEYVTDEDERPSLKELTNDQFYEFAEIVFQVNFEDAIKNFKNLFQRAKTAMSAEENQKLQ